MTDREMLEFAAKAAGIGGGWQFVRGRDTPICYRDVGGRVWNPLTDDGDAMRLAVKLDMCLGIAPHRVALDKTSLALAPGGSEVSVMHNGDPLAATRRAIVRAAAEIGKQIP